MLESYQRINRYVVISLTAVLLVIFAYSLASFYTSAPSPGFSRERVLAELSPRTIHTYDRPVAVVSSLDGNSITVATGDSGQLLLIRIDETGTAVSENRLDINIEDSPHVAGYRSSNGHLVLYYGKRTLERLDIDESTLEYKQAVVAENVRSFEVSGPRIAFTRVDGLYIWSEFEGHHPEPVLKGTVTRMSIDDTGNSTYVAAIVSSGPDSYNLESFQFNNNLEISDRLTLLDESHDEYYKNLRDIKVRNDKVSMLFVLRNNQYGVNYITVSRFNRQSGDILQELRTGVPIINCNYTLLDESQAGDESFLMRIRTIYGDNLGVCTLSEGIDPEFADLTKTRGLSVDSGYLLLNGIESLIFTDYSSDSRQILLSSSDPVTVQETTRWTQGRWGHIFGTTVIHYIISLFAMWIFLVATAIPSFLFVSIAQRFTRPRLLNTYLLIAIGAIGYTVLKLFVTQIFLSTITPQYILIPWVGTGLGLSLVSVVFSIISYGLTALSFKTVQKQDGSLFGVFLRFAIIDVIFYAAYFLIYGITAMLLWQI